MLLQAAPGSTPLYAAISGGTDNLTGMQLYTPVSAEKETRKEKMQGLDKKTEHTGNRPVRTALFELLKVGST